MVPIFRRIVLTLVSVLVVLCHGAFADEVDAEFDADFADEERLLQEEVVTRCNFWCQLKNSLGLTIVGLLLICIAPCLMWKNEGRHVTELRRIDFCKNKAVVVENSDLPSSENTGRLVHFTGQVSRRSRVGDDSRNGPQHHCASAQSPYHQAHVFDLPKIRGFESAGAE